ncbi:hypothetical protein FHS83_003191 [Rhizomicrobium palustre]|uniref:Uncharacterized protein n=1 Tax=Rhizomicrobium palustre TaxID=189966 RepID=A0A846N2N5_9PROT|nr:hypothetical protein [Rhizomicrobium palustre]NIK89873.1 hypothetical protein [Rhizomicrobium palustre]
MKAWIFVAAALSCSAAMADPLAKAHEGQLQCYHPNTLTKTCAVLSGYSFQGKVISNKADVLMGVKPLLIMTTNSPVTISGEAVCGKSREADIQSASFTADGAKVPENQAAAIRAQLLENMKPMFGKEICTTYVPSNNALSATVTIDGKPRPDLTQIVIWVKPGEGYKIGQ